MRLGERAEDEARTRYLHLGKVALYQMSYSRGTKVIIPAIRQDVKRFFNFFPDRQRECRMKKSAGHRPAEKTQMDLT